MPRVGGVIAPRDFLVRAAAVTAALSPALRAVTPAPDDDMLLKQKEAAAVLRVSVSYLRASDCPKVLLPGRGARPLVRYRRRELLAWAEHWTARRTTPEPDPVSRPVARNAGRA